jgi:hypothetical protein
MELMIVKYGSGLERFQVLAAANMKMAVLWVVAPCSPVKVYQFQRYVQGDYSPDDGGSKHL